MRKQPRKMPSMTGRSRLMKIGRKRNRQTISFQAMEPTMRENPEKKSQPKLLLRNRPVKSPGKPHLPRNLLKKREKMRAGNLKQSNEGNSRPQKSDLKTRQMKPCRKSRQRNRRMRYRVKGKHRKSRLKSKWNYRKRQPVNAAMMPVQ